MEKILLETLTAKTRALMEAPTCSAEAKAAAQRWLDAVGTDAENEARESYIAELEEDIMPIGKLIGFADSEAGKAYFGAEKAAGIAAHVKFQSTLPAWGETDPPYVAIGFRAISIHSPRMGRDYLYVNT